MRVRVRVRVRVFIFVCMCVRVCVRVCGVYHTPLPPSHLPESLSSSLPPARPHLTHLAESDIHKIHVRVTPTGRGQGNQEKLGLEASRLINDVGDRDILLGNPARAGVEGVLVRFSLAFSIYAPAFGV